ncbi:MAG: efflux RND transporter permease subunit, partial [Anaerovoracaceae bacterium]
SKEKVATAMTQEDGARNVVLSSSKTSAVTEENLEDLLIPVQDRISGETKEIRLGDIAELSQKETLNEIKHDNQKRTLRVTGEVDKEYNVTKVTQAAQAAVEKLELPSGVTLDFDGENEQIMDAMKQLLQMLILGLLMVYLVMVAQFQSLISPLIVMFTVPLAFTGGLIALLITGFEISVVSMIGFVVLMGVIVNNGIVLIDYINQLRRDGGDKKTAIIEGGATRLRPVLMTALTTILGLVPLALAMGDGGEMMQPVAIVCIGGLLYATLMTLVVIPIMYDLLNGRGQKRKNTKKVKNI